MTSKPGSKQTDLMIPLILLVIFWVIAIVLWQTTGYIFYLFNFGYIGTALAIGIGAYVTLPARKKPQGRSLAQFLIWCLHADIPRAGSA
jgi:hypothetical protein